MVEKHLSRGVMSWKHHCDKRLNQASSPSPPLSVMALGLILLNSWLCNLAQHVAGSGARPPLSGNALNLTFNTAYDRSDRDAV